MTTFDDRENAFEAKFAHDSEMQFRAEARRNKLLGLWVADRLGLDEDGAKKYVAEVIAADFEEAGDDDVYRKVSRDLEAKGAPMPEKDLRAKMAELMIAAKQQIVENR